jgi:hypothetical protein
MMHGHMGVKLISRIKRETCVEAAQLAESITNYKNTKYCSKQVQQYGRTKYVGAEQCSNSFEQTIKFSLKMAQ